MKALALALLAGSAQAADRSFRAEGVQGLEISISRQLNAKLHDYHFIGVAWRLPLPRRQGVKATVASSFHPRILAAAF